MASSLDVLRRGRIRCATYGCQMNVHDPERLTGLLEEAGYVAAPEGEGADDRLFGNLSDLVPLKAGQLHIQIAFALEMTLIGLFRLPFGYLRHVAEQACFVSVQLAEMA